MQLPICLRSTLRRRTSGRCQFHLVILRGIFTQLKYSIGRMDDVIIHASGEKTVPAPMEEVIMSSPM